MRIDKIIKYDGGYAIVTNYGRQYHWCPNLTRALLLLICWKRRGIIGGAQIDNLFINNLIEGI